MTIVVSLTRKEQLRRLLISCGIYSVLFLVGSLPLYGRDQWPRVFITAITLGLCFGLASRITSYFDGVGWHRVFSLTDWKNVFKQLLFGSEQGTLGQETMSKNSPDWWARIFGLFGILIGVVGLVLNYFNNRWQQQVYAKSQEERILVQVSARYDLSSVPSSVHTDPPQGQLAVEVVNLGMQPMYLKNVTGEIGGHGISFYEHDPLNTKEPMRRLEPGEAADYTKDWQWSLEDAEKEGGLKGTVDVETTKKQFTQPARIDRVTISSRVAESLLELIPRKKLPPPLRPK